jgi:methylthioribose-1-phosphate isomerase
MPSNISSSNHYDSLKVPTNLISASRTTAVNLFAASQALTTLMQECNESKEEVIESYIKAAEKMLDDDVADNKLIGEHAAAWLLENHAAPFKLLTHCNTGALATAGWLKYN